MCKSCEFVWMNNSAQNIKELKGEALLYGWPCEWLEMCWLLYDTAVWTSHPLVNLVGGTPQSLRTVSTAMRKVTSSFDNCVSIDDSIGSWLLRFFSKHYFVFSNPHQACAFVRNLNYFLRAFSSAAVCMLVEFSCEYLRDWRFTFSQFLSVRWFILCSCFIGWFKWPFVGGFVLVSLHIL